MDARLRAHWESIGAGTRAGYVAWCREHGFPPPRRKRAKPDALLAAERTHAEFLRSIERLPERIRHRALTMLRCTVGTRAELEVTGLRMPQGFHAWPLAVGVAGPVRASLRRLIRAVAATPLLKGEMRGVTRGLRSIAEAGDAWARRPEDWRPPRGAALMPSLAAWTLAKYPVPRCLHRAWEVDAPEEERAWYARVGAGGSLRQGGPAKAFSKAEAAMLARAPGTLRPAEGVRWAQVRAAGGSPAAAALLARSPRLRDFGDAEAESLRAEFFAWLGRTPGVRAVEAGGLLAWAEAVRLDGVARVEAGRPDLCPPRRPGLSFRGRTAASARREAARWRSERDALRRAAGLPPLEAPPQWTFVGGPDSFGLVRITTPEALVAEGRAMHHCVGEFVEAMRRDEFWSLRPGGSDRRDDRLTVHVSGTWCEAAGFANRPPTRAEWAALRAWGASRVPPLREYVTAG